jgi:hypothetical protein
MGLNKKDRRISIWIGIIIGVTLSSMLFRYAINDKNERSSMRLGSYDSNVTAVGNLPFPEIPKLIKDSIPRGLVLHFENNFSVSRPNETNGTDCWVIESGGVLRSERLFILAENNGSAKVDFYRACELYITATENSDLKDLEKELPEDNFRILGQNKKTLEYILQIKEFYPGKLREYLQQIPIQFRSIKEVRLYPWLPPH